MLSLENLYVSYGDVTVVQDVSLEVKKGEIVGIVGESGSGKSTALASVLRLDPAASVTGGSIIFEGKDITVMEKKELRTVRGNDIAMIFQNAAMSMDPMKTIGHLFYETVYMHHPEMKKDACFAQAKSLMERMRLQDTGRILKSYPFEMSGGMCQRIAIAAAMMNHPKLILADEPTSALDVTAQAEVIRLMRLLRDDFGTSMLIVTHNMGVVAQLTDKVAVMYGGRIVEFGTTADVMENPAHPYTQALLRAVPRMDGTLPKGIAGMPPEFGKKIKGCVFADRCCRARASCRDTMPGMQKFSETHWTACNVTKEGV
ncbi:ABC transporter ATP-binding protein [Ruminococcus gauvreauii]|uniref:ABC transporter ATP-binding protein n=1 Tax=Ruminococcus gauvreauii TaxID=438033 RepID=A0ABY5VF09_9FIRM|nr:ABC transporter ATP-binding protein [Ruminococcus gauvreauii]UWP58828.1 ABC transporter ATP-binding protein [Ruminococcus gauvreauii]